MQNKTNKLKIHLPFLIIISLLAVISFPDLLSNRCFSRGDLFSVLLPAHSLIRESLIEHKQIPLWDHGVTSGVPFLAVGQGPVFYPVFVLLILLFDYCAATNLTILFTILFSGITAYFMMIYLKFKREIALISAIIYMFNSFTLHWSYAPLGFGIPFLPLIFITVSEAVKSKNWIFYSFLSALLFSIVFHAGSIFIFLYFFIFLGLFLGFKLISKRFLKKLPKIVFISLIILLFTLGLCAIKLMSSLEFAKVTSRADGFSYEKSKQPTIPLKDYPKSLFKGNAGISETTALVGIIIIPFLLLSLAKIKNKKVLFFWFVLIFALILVSNRNPLYYFFWRFIPGFKFQRHVWRAMVLFTFSSSILAGVGASVFCKYLETKFNLKKRQLFTILMIIALLIFLDLTIFKGWDLKKRIGYLEEKNAQFKENKMLNYVVNDTDISRLHFNEVTGIGFGITQITAYKNIELLYGLYGSVWVPEYINFHLSYAMQNKAKFWGMLNVKYLASTKPINLSGFEFIRKFDECDICRGGEHIDGPYLYKNELYLPRAYIAKHGILVVGKKEAVQGIVYGIMLGTAFNPVNTVIVSGDKESINDYEIEELRKFDAIFLTQGSINQHSDPILQAYANTGGVIIPNVLEGKNEIDTNKLGELLLSFGGSYSDINKADITYYSPNKIYIDVKNKEGFLVYSERFPVFGGWQGYVDGKKNEVMRANGIIAAVPIKAGSKELRLEYKPKSYRIGSIITIVTIILLAVFFISRFFVSARRRRLIR